MDLENLIETEQIVWVLGLFQLFFPTDYDEFQLIWMNFCHSFGIQKWMLRLHSPVSTVRSFLGPFREALSLGGSPNGIAMASNRDAGLSVRLLTTQLHFLAGETSSKMTPWSWKTHNTKSHLPKGRNCGDSSFFPSQFGMPKSSWGAAIHPNLQAHGAI